MDIEYYPKLNHIIIYRSELKVLNTGKFYYFTWKFFVILKSLTLIFTCDLVIKIYGPMTKVYKIY